MEKFQFILRSCVEFDKQNIRHILLFYYRKAKNVVQARKKLDDVYEEGVLGTSVPEPVF